MEKELPGISGKTFYEKDNFLFTDISTCSHPLANNIFTKENSTTTASKSQRKYSQTPVATSTASKDQCHSAAAKNTTTSAAASTIFTITEEKNAWLRRERRIE
jgi:hypothetical protein